MRGIVLHAKKLRHRIPVPCLLDIGASGGSYISIKLSHSLHRWGAVHGKLRTRGRGRPHATNPAESSGPPMGVCRSRTILVIFHPDRLTLITVSVVRKLQYGTINGPVFPVHQSIFDIDPEKSPKPESSVS